MSEETTMNETLLLAALRTDLGVTSQAFSERLIEKIQTAEARIAESFVAIGLNGVTPDANITFTGK